MSADPIEDVYPLSPLQHGMLFHALSEPRSGVDIEQMVCTLRERIDPDSLLSAWQKVVTRHPILRTAFQWEDQPAQKVWRDVEIPWRIEDWRSFPEAEQESRLAGFLAEDRERGFAMDQPPLLRLTLFMLGESDHRLVWTFHHALLDGRSFPLVLSEVFAVYDSPELPLAAASPTFRAHLDFQQARKMAEAEAFWRERLRGAAGSSFPKPQRSTAPTRTQGDVDATLSASTTTRLKRLATAHDVTLNTIVQGAWALLLSRYTREEDIVFGAARACRRSSVPGAENIVGLLINTLPLRVQVESSAQLMPWLQTLRQQWIAMRGHEQTPLATVQACADLGNGRALFDTIVVFENYELNDHFRNQRGHWSGRTFRLYEQTSFALTLAAYSGPELHLRIGFNRRVFDESTTARILGQLRVTMESIAENPEQSLGDLSLISEAEKHQLVFEWNPPAPVVGALPTLHELFEKQARLTPQNIALSCGGETLSYVDLEARASVLAQHLRALGSGPEVLVGLFLEPSIDLIVGLLAILKSGGAYLPIDQAYPPDRIAFMLSDARAQLILTHSRVAPSLPQNSAQIVCIDQAPSASAALNLTAEAATEQNLAYVIYTSGSTGKPKGCCLTHRNVTRLFHSTADWFHFNDDDVWTMFHSVAFDFSVWEIWGALLHGGKLVIVPHHVSRSPELFHELLVREEVTVLNQTPAAFRQLIVADLASMRSAELSLRLVIFGGEALALSSLQPWFDRHGDTSPQLVNMYGITETTVHVTYRPLRATDLQGGSVIGIPIPDLQLYILDQALRPVPIGLPGELFVGGAGLAREYLHRPELTAQRFVPSPFHPGAKLYRTGDLARWLPERDIEYLGRVDEQVKIRGFRIELGEIESALLRHPDIREALVLSCAASESETRLVAYFVADDPAPSISGLRAHLKLTLPDYMVPSVFVALKHFPLTQNGKVDRRALPPPEPQRPELSSAFAPPRSFAEQALVSIWQEVLRIEHVGIHDNFFELGGDSILSILVISKARKAGLPLTPKHLFEHQTIAELATCRGAGAAIVNEAPVVGPIASGPIQRWFFEQNFTDRNHWNQSFHFRASGPLNSTALAAAVRAVVRHHSAFRQTVSDHSFELVITAEACTEAACMTIVVSDETEIVRHSEAAQTSLNLAAGPLLRVVHFQTVAGSRILVVAHHLAIDGVSWRILIEDLETAYEQALAGLPVVLPPATTSVARWAQLLSEAAKSSAIRAEQSYWESLARRPADQLPVDFANGDNSEQSAQTVVVQLTPHETESLRRVPEGIESALLAALSDAFCAWTGADSLLLELEGHGREEALIADLTQLPPADLSRTIGWFTTISPLRLHRGMPAGPRPHRGMGYGLLRYLAAEPFGDSPEVLFNYLGQFENALGTNRHLQIATDPTGPWHSPSALRTHLIEINCSIVFGRFEARWSYSSNIHSAKTVESLANRFLAALRGTMPDLAASTGASASLPLSPIQRLYFTLESAKPNAGFDQWHCALHGPVEPNRFIAAWREVFLRHPILRTAFRENECGESAQQILPDALPDFRVEDWRGFPDAEQHDRLEAFLKTDRARGFDLSKPPLTRLTLFRFSETQWQFVWSHHHLQIDGWSWPLIWRDVSALYEGKFVEPARPYRDFIDWLARQQISASERFWRETLSGFLRPTPLPVSTSPHPAQVEFHELSLELSDAVTRDLQELARRERVTLNTVVQAAWALLLGRFSGTHDIVFGASFSGRPAELDGVESIVGPFVNNLPIRVSLNAAESLAALVQRIQAHLFAVSEHQFAPLPSIQSWSGLPWQERIFESLVVFQNFLVDDDSQRVGREITVRDLHAPIRTNYPLTIVAIPGPRLRLTTIASANFFDKHATAVVVDSLSALLSAFPQANSRTTADFQDLLTVATTARAAARDFSGIAPQTPLEHAIAAVWQDAFRTGNVGIDRNFFDLGGHSLLMLQVHSRLTQALGKKVSIVQMFQHPTIRSLARFLEGTSGAEANAMAEAKARAEKQKAVLSRRKLAVSQTR